LYGNLKYIFLVVKMNNFEESANPFGEIMRSVRGTTAMNQIFVQTKSYGEEDECNQVPYGFSGFLSEPSDVNSWFRCYKGELDEDEDISVEDSNPSYFRGMDTQRVVGFMEELIFPTSGLGKQIFEEIGKYGKVVTDFSLGEKTECLLGPEGPVSLTKDQIKNFSEDSIHETDQMLCYELLNENETYDFLTSDDPVMSDFRDTLVAVSDEDVKNNYIEDYIKNLSKTKLVKYKNYKKKIVSLSQKKVLYPKISMSDWIQKREVRFPDLKLNDFFWDGVNAVVEHNGFLFLVDEPVLCISFDKNNKKFKFVVYSIRQTHVIGRDLFKLSYGFKIPMEFTVYPGAFPKWAVVDKNGNKKSQLIWYTCRKKIEIKKELLHEYMVFFKKRRFLFCEIVSQDLSLVNITLERNLYDKNFDEARPRPGIKNEILMGRDENFKTGDDLVEKFYLVLWGDFGGIKEPQDVFITCKMWYEFMF